uniref:Uncharacterized protein n=1 Tax=Knipowitschia caucasica TaxID=637954 RepID=A0AAV2LI27_KNICA
MLALVNLPHAHALVMGATGAITSMETTCSAYEALNRRQNKRERDSRPGQCGAKQKVSLCWFTAVKCLCSWQGSWFGALARRTGTDDKSADESREL